MAIVFHRLTLAAAVLLFAAQVGARPEYHQALTDAAGTVCPAELCVACHENAAGGGSFTQPFFGALLVAGYDFAKPSSMAPALNELRAAATDTDNDGVPDTEEITQATNPNAEGDEVYCGGPEFGCLRVARGNPPPRVGVLLLLVLGAAWLRRRSGMSLAQGHSATRAARALGTPQSGARPQREEERVSSSHASSGWGPDPPSLCSRADRTGLRAAG